MVNPELMTGLGAALSIFLSSAGSSYASVHAGAFALRSPANLGIKAFFPIIIAGVLAIYGIIIAVILSAEFNAVAKPLTETDGYRNFSAGLAVGLACLASGLGIGRFMEAQRTACVRSNRRADDTQAEPLLASNSPPFARGIWSVLIVLVFLEAIGLYGLIVALFLSG